VVEGRPPSQTCPRLPGRKLVVKWDLTNKKVMKGSATRRVIELIETLDSEGML